MSFSLLLPLLAACSPPDGDLVLTDAHNYSFQASLEAERVPVQEYADATIDWSALTTDLQQRVVDPLAVDRLSLVQLALSADEVLAAVAGDSLNQSDVIDYRLLEGIQGRTRASLSEFSILGNSFDPTTELTQAGDDATWILSLWDLDRNGRDDILTSMILLPDPASSAQDLAFTDASALFTMTPDLQGATPLETGARLGAWTADWSAVTTTGTGGEFDDELADRLLILHLDAELSAVEDDFVALSSNATEAWRLDVYAERTADLLQAAAVDGSLFPGFSTEGTWLLGVECTSCSNPVPKLLAVVDVAR